MTTSDLLRQEVRRAIDEAGLTQRAVAAELGITEQHVSRMLTGKSLLTLEWADRIVTVCGRQLSVALASPSAGAS